MSLIYHLINQKLKTFLCISAPKIQGGLQMAILDATEYFALGFIFKSMKFQNQDFRKRSDWLEKGVL